MGKSWDQYRLGEPYEAPRRKGLKTLAIVAALMAITILPAMAARGGGGGSATHGGGKGGGGKNSGAPATGTINRLILVDPTSDGLPHWNHTITFDVSSTAQYYFVRVDCKQGDTLVYEKSNGFYIGWMWGRDYGLSGPAWPGGGADCTAVLYSQNVDATNQQTLDSMSFRAEA